MSTRRRVTPDLGGEELDMTDKLNVLILDDEPIVGKRLKPALAKIGCEVETFVDPREALDVLEKKVFDIVVTDIRMDEIDGMQVLASVIERSPRTKVIMITGYAMMDLAREAMSKGAFDFISKPFKPDDLRRAIAKAAEALGASVDFEDTGETPA
jgi:DNA-binding NtrC family response regulator